MSYVHAKSIISSQLSKNAVEALSDGEIRSYLQEIADASRIYIDETTYQNSIYVISIWKRSDDAFRLLVARRRLYTADLYFDYDQRFEHIGALKSFCNQQDFGTYKSIVLNQLNQLISEST
jgi:hypothetical protein